MTFADPLVIIFAVAAAALVLIAALAILPSTPAFRQILVGVSTDPQLVGLMRGALLYALPLASGAALAWVAGWHDPRLLGFAPFVVGAIRWGEGKVDGLLKPEQNNRNPPPVAGSGAGDPSQ